MIKQKKIHNMKFSLTVVIALFVSVLFYPAFAQNTTSSYWSQVIESEIPSNGKRLIIPKRYQTWRLNLEKLKSILASTPNEKSVPIHLSENLIELVDPSGQLQTFKVVEAPMMEAELAAAFPGIRTYNLKGVSDKYANGKLDYNDLGMHASVRSPKGDYFIDPYATENTQDYIVYFTTDFEKDPNLIIPEAGLIQEEGEQKPAIQIEESDSKKKESAKIAGAACVGDRLRTYRLAVACTGEYAQAATGINTPTVSQVLSRVVTTVNRVNGVYESEVSVRLVLISNNSSILFTDPATDPFTGNNNSSTLISESQSVIGGTIGSGNYDIGHTFSTGGGGLAMLGSVCTTSKARGITGSPAPVGDPYDIDYVAHEIGHQFGGRHTFNALTGSCSGNRSASTSMEPGSGITIMAYAGLCGGANNLASNSIPYFHAISYDEIVNFSSISTGNNCAAPSNTGNNAPVVDAPVSFTIPKITAFELEGSATDADGDALLYSWEGFDKGLSGGNWNSGSVPYFRSYAPDTIAYRMFPKLSVVLGGSTTGIKGEYYPQSAQTLNFRLAARDGKMGGGGVCYAATQVVIANSGPFKVTDPNTAGIVWYQGAWPVVTWDVAGTEAAPVSCDKVNILISTDGGANFFQVVGNTENDGVASVPVPAVSAPISTCRLRIECANNIFFDINDFNFAISDIVNTDPYALVSPPILKIQPNPGSSLFALKVNQEQFTETMHLNLTDLSGKVIRSEVFSGSQFSTQWDLSAYSDGIYLLTVSSIYGKTVQKLIKASGSN